MALDAESSFEEKHLSHAAVNYSALRYSPFDGPPNSGPNSFQSSQFCFDVLEFNHDTFDAHAFVTAQLGQSVSLEMLRSDLERYGQMLKTQLIDLLNRDYADFISLASNLVG